LATGLGFFFCLAAQPHSDLGCIIVEAYNFLSLSHARTRTHTHTHTHTHTW